jgi:hypothetical protein
VNTHGRAWEKGEEAGRESSLRYPLQPRQDPTRDSSVLLFNEHNRRQRITEYRRTPSDQDFTRSRENLEPSPGSLVILIKLKCLSPLVRTEIKKGLASDNAGPYKVKKVTTGPAPGKTLCVTTWGHGLQFV